MATTVNQAFSEFMKNAVNLMKVQKLLFEHRAGALMIPDLFYRLFRDKQQEFQDKIASQMVLDKDDQ